MARLETEHNEVTFFMFNLPLWQFTWSPVTVHSHLPSAKLSFGAFVTAVELKTSSLIVHLSSSLILEERPPLNQTSLKLSGLCTGVNWSPTRAFLVLIWEEGQTPLRKIRGGSCSFLQGQPVIVAVYLLKYQVDDCPTFPSGCAIAFPPRRIELDHVTLFRPPRVQKEAV